jgi:hypothetical protein
MPPLNLAQIRVIDPILTTVAHGFTNPLPGVANFIAPRVPVLTRAGKVMVFGKESFAITNTKRAPATNIKRLMPNFGTENYSVEQDALGAEIPYEFLEEAAATAVLNGIPMNLQQMALNAAMSSLDLNWENEVLSLVTRAEQFEPILTSVPSTKINTPDFDLLKLILAAKEAVRSQSAVYPNSMVVGPKVFSAMQQITAVRETIKYQQRWAATVADLSTYFGLSRGIRVAEGVKLDEAGNLIDIMGNDILLFYAPEQPVGLMNKGVPSFAYTYALEGYPVVTPFRADPDRRVIVADAIREQSVQITGIGTTGKAAAGYLFKDVLTA